MHRHDLVAALTHIRRSVRIAERAGLDTRAGQARISLAGALAVQGNLRAALTEADRAAAVLHGRDLARLNAQRAFIFDRSGQRSRALESYTKALPALRKAGDKRSEAVVLHNRGLAHAHLGAFATAQADLLRAEQLLDGLGDDLGVAEVRVEPGMGRSPPGRHPHRAGPVRPGRRVLPPTAARQPGGAVRPVRGVACRQSGRGGENDGAGGDGPAGPGRRGVATGRGRPEAFGGVPALWRRRSRAGGCRHRPPRLLAPGPRQLRRPRPLCVGSRRVGRRRENASPARRGTAGRRHARRYRMDDRCARCPADRRPPGPRYRARHGRPSPARAHERAAAGPGHAAIACLARQGPAPACRRRPTGSRGRAAGRHARARHSSGGAGGHGAAGPLLRPRRRPGRSRPPARPRGRQPCPRAEVGRAVAGELAAATARPPAGRRRLGRRPGQAAPGTGRPGPGARYRPRHWPPPQPVRPRSRSQCAAVPARSPGRSCTRPRPPRRLPPTERRWATGRSSSSSLSTASCTPS